MAKSPELVMAVAKITNRPTETVKVALRRLHEAKLVEVTGKGRGGKQMTAKDGAMLLLSLAGGGTLRDSSETIKAYWRLLPTPASRSKLKWRIHGGSPSLGHRYFERLFGKDITELDTFGQAMTTIVQRAIDGTLFPTPTPEDLLDPTAPWPPKGDWRPYVTFRVLGPMTAASIHAGFNNQWFFEMTYGASSDHLFGISNPTPYFEMRQIGFEAIMEIARTLR